MHVFFMKEVAVQSYNDIISDQMKGDNAYIHL
jgi:hypothetical protein